MADGKSLKFQFVLDEQSFARVKRALNDLTTEAGKFQKAMNGNGGGLFSGANVGRPPSAAQTQGRTPSAVGANAPKTGIGASILGDIEAFQKLAKSGKDGMNTMTDAVRRGVSEQMREIDKLEKKMAVLQGRFNKDPRTMVDGPVRDRYYQNMVARQAQLNGAQANLAQLQQVQNGLNPPQNVGGVPPGGIVGAASTGPMASASTLKSIGMVGGVIAGAAMAALHETMGATRQYGAAEATRGSMLNGEIRRVRGGDVTGMVALRDMLTDSSRAKDFRAQTGTVATLESMQKGAKGAVANITNLATGGLFNLGNGGTILGGLTDASLDSDMMKNTLKQVRDYEDSPAFLGKKMALERFYGEFGSRKGVGRILGTGLSIDPKTGRPRDSHATLNSSLTGSGYDIDSYASSYAGARNSAGGDFARKNAFGIMAAGAAGYQGYGEMMAGAARSGRGGSGLLALGGGIGAAAGIQLGSGVIGSGFDVRGTTGGAGVLNAAQGPGFNFSPKSEDNFNQVQQILAGMGLGGSISTGGMDTYQAGRNVIGAIGLNGGGTTYAQDYLGTGMSLKQMMDGAGGDLTKTAKSLGLDSSMLKGQLSGSMSSIMDRFVDQGGTDPMSKAVRGYRSSGVSIDKYLNSLYTSGDRGSADALGSYFGMMSGEGEEAGIGLAGLLGGVDTKGKSGKGPSGGRGDMEKALDEQRANTIKEDGQVIEGLYKSLKSSLELAPQTSRALTEAGTDLSKTADRFIATLENLATAVDMKAYELSRGVVGNQGPVKATAPAPGFNPNGGNLLGGGPKY